MDWDQGDFFDRLSLLLDEAGLKQKDLGAFLGLPQSAISHWSKKNNPLFKHVARAAAHFGWSLDYLAFGQVVGPAEHEWIEVLRRLSDQERAQLLGFVSAMLARGSKSAQEKGAAKSGRTAGGASVIQEDAPPRLIDLERKVRPINRRAELPVFSLCRDGAQGARPMKLWLNLAAGYGEDLELCDELWYVREFPRWSNLHLARVRGDSMLETLIDGDVVVLDAIGPEGRGYALPTEPLLRTQMESLIKDRSICMARLNDTVTIKRLRYDGNGEDWDLYIEADNPIAWESYRVKKKDSLTIYATVKGLAK